MKRSCVLLVPLFLVALKPGKAISQEPLYEPNFRARPTAVSPTDSLSIPDRCNILECPWYPDEWEHIVPGTLMPGLSLQVDGQDTIVSVRDVGNNSPGSDLVAQALTLYPGLFLRYAGNEAWGLGLQATLPVSVHFLGDNNHEELFDDSDAGGVGVEGVELFGQVALRFTEVFDLGLGFVGVFFPDAGRVGDRNDEYGGDYRSDSGHQLGAKAVWGISLSPSVWTGISAGYHHRDAGEEFHSYQVPEHALTAAFRLEWFLGALGGALGRMGRGLRVSAEYGLLGTGFDGNYNQWPWVAMVGVSYVPKGDPGTKTVTRGYTPPTCEEKDDPLCSSMSAANRSAELQRRNGQKNLCSAGDDREGRVLGYSICGKERNQYVAGDNFFGWKLWGGIGTAFPTRGVGTSWFLGRAGVDLFLRPYMECKTCSKVQLRQCENGIDDDGDGLVDMDDPQCCSLCDDSEAAKCGETCWRRRADGTDICMRKNPCEGEGVDKDDPRCGGRDCTVLNENGDTIEERCQVKVCHQNQQCNCREQPAEPDEIVCCSCQWGEEAMEAAAVVGATDVPTPGGSTEDGGSSQAGGDSPREGGEDE